VLMYFSEPAGDTTHVVAPSVVTTLALTLGTVATLVLGILPSPLLDLASSSSLFLR
jgi:NADH-quinone oxidoreductase subunit N